MRLDIRTVARVVGGRLAPEGATAVVTGISTDSRTVRPGDLFIPLRGRNFDGHDFLAQAAQRGAVACLSEEMIAGFPVPVVGVADTLRALGDLAAAVRRHFDGPVVAVTGSSGKTTTKEMLGAILSETAPGLKTEGNYNNLVGLPQTLFRLCTRHRWVVLEMGMSARGEIARLAEIAAPAVGVVTNIGSAHLETLRSIDGVARAKGELFAALVPGSTAVINADDERVAQLPVANGVRRLLFGLHADADVRADQVATARTSVRFRLLLAGTALPVTLQVPGRHNVANALAAAAAATALGIAPETIRKGLERFRPVAGRMEAVSLRDGVTLLEDSYNANPLSMRAALVALDELAGSGCRIAVLGDMLELGPSSASLHREIGEEAARRADWLLVLGEMAGEVASGALNAGMPASRVLVFTDHEEIAGRLREILRPGDRVLVKGSRGMRMEKVSATLRDIETRLAAGNC